MRLLKNVTKAKQTLRSPIADPAARSDRACGFAPLLVRLRTLPSAKLRLRHFATRCEMPPLRMTLGVKVKMTLEDALREQAPALRTTFRPLHDRKNPATMIGRGVDFFIY